MAKFCPSHFSKLCGFVGKCIGTIVVEKLNIYNMDSVIELSDQIVDISRVSVKFLTSFSAFEY